MHQCTLAPLDLGQLPGLRKLYIDRTFWGRPSDATDVLRIFEHLPQLTHFAAIVTRNVVNRTDSTNLARVIGRLQRSMPELDIKLIKGKATTKAFARKFAQNYSALCSGLTCTYVYSFELDLSDTMLWYSLGITILGSIRG
jgi:hypothetical protein